jgi:hypothetical protein
MCCGRVSMPSSLEAKSSPLVHMRFLYVSKSSGGDRSSGVMGGPSHGRRRAGTVCCQGRVPREWGRKPSGRWIRKRRSRLEEQITLRHFESGPLIVDPVVQGDLFCLHVFVVVGILCGSDPVRLTMCIGVWHDLSQSQGTTCPCVGIRDRFCKEAPVLKG